MRHLIKLTSDPTKKEVKAHLADGEVIVLTDFSYDNYAASPGSGDPEFTYVKYKTEIDQRISLHKSKLRELIGEFTG
jgi:hypothetical protein